MSRMACGRATTALRSSSQVYKGICFYSTIATLRTTYIYQLATWYHIY